MTQWFVVYVLMWGGSTFSPGMHPVYDANDCKTQGDAFVIQMGTKGYGANDRSWASYHCLELPYNEKL